MHTGPRETTATTATHCRLQTDYHKPPRFLRPSRRAVVDLKCGHDVPRTDSTTSKNKPHRVFLAGVVRHPPGRRPRHSVIVAYEKANTLGPTALVTGGEMIGSANAAALVIFAPSPPTKMVSGAAVIAVSTTAIVPYRCVTVAAA